MIADKAGMLGLYPTTGGVTSPRNRMMYVTCSVLRKYYKDHRKEEYDMSLEKDKKDRSYQYGRLLAVYEKMEWDTYNEDDKKKRMTNALRIQSTFSKRPCYASAIIREQLQKGYIQKLSVGTRTYYDKLIGEIMEKISGFPDAELNKPLEGSYLIGYYMQRNALFTGKTKDTGNGNEAKDGTVIIEG
jgi:CRISPR-associated protein Csd1